jgi:hypothetical protein
MDGLQSSTVKSFVMSGRLVQVIPRLLKAPAPWLRPVSLTFLLSSYTSTSHLLTTPIPRTALGSPITASSANTAAHHLTAYALAV